MSWNAALSLVVLGALVMSGDRAMASVDSAQDEPGDPLRGVAERYVKLVLAVGQHDVDYVDAYYGPPEWRTEAEKGKKPLADLTTEATALIDEVATAPTASPRRGDEELWTLRRQYLGRQLEALKARVSMLQGTRLTFDEESRALYDAEAPHIAEAELEKVLSQLDSQLPGEGALVDRYDRFKQGFVIPRDKLDGVFHAAIRGCRDRTFSHLDMPPTESFSVEYVTGKSWGGYNWYQGNYRSVIQVNTDLPIYIERAVDLACHEGYPGHHVYNALLEQRLVRDRGWIEFTVYPLFSPQSLIAEGTANYGIEVAFSKDDRLTFERDLLFPLAGIDPKRAADYYRVVELVDQLSYAGNEAARQYIDGKITREEAASWLEKYAMMPRARAEQRVRFFDQYRSYVINYNLGRDLVAAFIERRAGKSNSLKRWQEFAALLSSPRLPSGLK